MHLGLRTGIGTSFKTFNVVVFSEWKPSNRFQIGTDSRFVTMQLESKSNMYTMIPYRTSPVSIPRLDEPSCAISFWRGNHKLFPHDRLPLLFKELTEIMQPSNIISWIPSLIASNCICITQFLNQIMHALIPSNLIFRLLYSDPEPNLTFEVIIM